MSQKPLDAAKPLRAAQYVRMSSNPQKYSIEIQAAAIATYAARRGIEIVCTYSDPGRSGLRIKGRGGLQKLIHDVQNCGADFDCILVFDVSRWGRFQDVDESAHYEFLCKKAGLPVHYCAEEFENDDSFTSAVLKNLARLKAAGVSKDLSKTVFLGQCNIVNKGYWRGGPAAYGLRRMLVGENGKPKGVLQFGQCKNLKTERVTLVPGPKSEIKVVNRIFTSFVAQKKNRSQIAEELNADGILSRCGKRWTSLSVSNLLENEIYLGHLVYNRRSTKLGERTVINPPEMWIRHNNVFKGIVHPRLFARAQKRLREVEHNKKETDQQLLDRLSSLLRQKGRLTLQIMENAKNVRHATVYIDRFGSLVRAFELVGYKTERRYRFAESTNEIEQTVHSVVDDIIIDLRGRGVNCSFLNELHLLTISGGVTVAVAVARSVSDGDTRMRRWEIRRLKYRKADLTLLIRMDRGNEHIKDYFLMPAGVLPVTKDGKLRVSDRLFSHMRIESFEALLAALYDRLHVARTDAKAQRNPAFKFIQQGETRTPRVVARPRSARERTEVRPKAKARRVH